MSKTTKYEFVFDSKFIPTDFEDYVLLDYEKILEEYKLFENELANDVKIPYTKTKKFNKSKDGLVLNYYKELVLSSDEDFALFTGGSFNIFKAGRYYLPFFPNTDIILPLKILSGVKIYINEKGPSELNKLFSNIDDLLFKNFLTNEQAQNSILFYNQGYASTQEFYEIFIIPNKESEYYLALSEKKISSKYIFDRYYKNFKIPINFDPKKKYTDILICNPNTYLNDQKKMFSNPIITVNSQANFYYINHHDNSYKFFL